MLELSFKLLPLLLREQVRFIQHQEDPVCRKGHEINPRDSTIAHSESNCYVISLDTLKISFRHQDI